MNTTTKHLEDKTMNNKNKSKMEKKQSSIEWLIEQMIKYELVPKGIHFDNILFHQAKAMHKEEIIESYCQGCLDMTNDDTIFPRETSEQYYNEKFNQ